MMKRTNGLLIGISLFVCAVIGIFLGLWLIDQYQREQFRLSTSIQKDLIAVSDKVTEDMMLDLLRTPLLQNKVNVKKGVTIKSIQSIGNSNTIPSNLKSTVRIIVKTADSSSENLGRFQHKEHKNVHVFSSSSRLKTVNISTTDSFPTKNNPALDGLFSKGLKVFVNQLAAAQTGGNVTSITQQQLDTILFKKKLARLWSNDGLKYALVFGKKHLSKNNYTYQAPKLFNQDIQLITHNQASVIFTAVLPEIGFAVFVLTLIILSFSWFYRSWKKQAELNQLRLDFIHNMSHELKTPVSTVKIALEALNKYNQKEDPSKVEEYLNVMEHEMNRLDQLVERVLMSNKSETSSWTIKKEKIQLYTLISAKTEHLKSLADWNNVQFTLSSNNQEGLIHADSFHLEGLLQNLCDNALKYVGNKVKIEIKLQHDEDGCTIYFEDDGMGIPTAYQHNIFDAFVRVPSATNTHNVKGYGLGLNYCKQVMALHGGSITYYSVSPTGAGFKLTFPN